MKNGIKRILLILFFVLLIAIVGVIVYSVTSNKNILGDLVSNIKNENVDDYHNGVYYYERPLNANYYVYSGCNVSSLNTYIVVMNDKYLVYDGSCIRNLKIDEGKTEDLVFSVNKDTKKYQITYDDKTFKKNDKVTQIVTANNLSNRYNESNLEVLEFVIQQIESEEEFFPITNLRLSGSTKYYTFELKKDKNANFYTETFRVEKGSTYSYSFVKLEDRAKLYFVNNYLVIIEPLISKVGTEEMYRYNLVLLSESGTYSLKQEFPINVNETRVDLNNNIYIIPGKNNTFKMIVGKDSTFCNDDKKDSEEISYYEFVLTFNYDKNVFNSPELVKIGRYSEGCSYVKKNYFGG